MNANAAADAGSIRQRAYELWERDGRPEGQEIDYWVRAEAVLASEVGGPDAPSRLKESPSNGVGSPDAGTDPGQQPRPLEPPPRPRRKADA